jgi:hypothetical protein
MLDDHACDSNHKKMLSMTQNLCEKYMDATAMCSNTDLYYLEITCTVEHSTLTVWEDEVKAAELRCLSDLKVMIIYVAQLRDSLVLERLSAMGLDWGQGQN